MHSLPSVRTDIRVTSLRPAMNLFATECTASELVVTERMYGSAGRTACLWLAWTSRWLHLPATAFAVLVPAAYSMN